METEIEILRKHIQALEGVLTDLIDCVEQGNHIDYSEELQDLVDEAKSVIEGEYE